MTLGKSLLTLRRAVPTTPVTNAEKVATSPTGRESLDAGTPTTSVGLIDLYVQLLYSSGVDKAVH